MRPDRVGGDKIAGDKVGGDKVVGTQIKDVAGNVIIYQQVADKDTARNLRIRQHLLEQLQATWIHGVLENSLHEVVRLELGLESQPEAVERPWVVNLERPNQPAQELPPTGKILDTFRALSGSMLILGEPGSGKTITLLELASELRKVAVADDQQPIPLVFNLSSWAQERKPLIDWLVGELFLVYGVGRKQATEWLKAMPFHLLLDGLDEVSAKYRDECVMAINAFRKEYGPVNIVVCSRVEEYEQLTNRLQLLGAAVIQPLNQEQINVYLSAAGSHLPQVVNQDESLQKLTQSPLTLNIIILAYRDQPSEAGVQYDTDQQRRHHLFTAYVDRMFGRRNPTTETDKNQFIQYLTFLAARMQKQAQSVYYIEKMQSTWLGRQNQQYKIIYGLIVGLIFGLYFGLYFGLIVGLIVGLISGLISGRREIKLTETLTWSWKKGRVGGLIVGLFFGFPLVVYGGWIFGLLLVTLTVLTFGFIGNELKMKSTPNQGIKTSGRNGLFFGLIFGLIFGLFFGLVILFVFLPFFAEAFVEVRVFGLIDILVSVIFVGLLVGMIVGLGFGGNAFFKHYLIRWFLARSNHLPLKLVPFLDEMTDRILLRKVGGGYIFVHRMMLEYFASLENEM